MSSDSQYPRIGQAFRLVLVFLLVQIGLGIPAAAVGLGEHPAALALGSVVATAVVVGLGIKRTGVSFRDVFPLGAVRLSLLIAMLLTVVGLSAVLSEVDNLFRSVFPIPPGYGRFLNGMVGGKKGLWGPIVALALVAPATEEVLFRGLILRGFLARYGVRKAIVASALLFALVHLNPWQFAGATAVGILLGWCFFRTRSLVPCLFGHAVNNSLPFVFTALHVKVPGYTSGVTEQVVHQPLWLDAAGLLLAAVGIALLKRSFGSQRS